ncbi:hypothetical protein GSH05_21455, partial [Burkholderia pseudomallei]|nr:hypothetical protein [Burkholderia pseudomallei]
MIRTRGGGGGGGPPPPPPPPRGAPSLWGSPPRDEAAGYVGSGRLDGKVALVT